MKHLLNGVAIAAALAIAAPALAQTPMAPGGAPAASAPPAAAPAAKAPKKRVATRAPKGGKAAKGSSDNSMTSQLNREELARVGGGAPGAGPAPMARSPGGAGQGG